MSEEGRTKRIRKNTRKIGEKQEEKRRRDGEGERGETILGCKTSTLLEEEELYLIIFYSTTGTLLWAAHLLGPLILVMVQ